MADLNLVPDSSLGYLENGQPEAHEMQTLKNAIIDSIPAITYYQDRCVSKSIAEYFDKANFNMTKNHLPIDFEKHPDGFLSHDMKALGYGSRMRETEKPNHEDMIKTQKARLEAKLLFDIVVRVDLSSMNDAEKASWISYKRKQARMGTQHNKAWGSSLVLVSASNIFKNVILNYRNSQYEQEQKLNQSQQVFFKSLDITVNHQFANVFQALMRWLHTGHLSVPLAEFHLFLLMIQLFEIKNIDDDEFFTKICRKSGYVWSRTDDYEEEPGRKYISPKTFFELFPKLSLLTPGNLCWVTERSPDQGGGNPSDPESCKNRRMKILEQRHEAWKTNPYPWSAAQVNKTPLLPAPEATKSEVVASGNLDGWEKKPKWGFDSTVMSSIGGGNSNEDQTSSVSKTQQENARVQPKYHKIIPDEFLLPEPNEANQVKSWKGKRLRHNHYLDFRIALLLAGLDNKPNSRKYRFHEDVGTVTYELWDKLEARLKENGEEGRDKHRPDYDIIHWGFGRYLWENSVTRLITFHKSTSPKLTFFINTAA